MLHDIVINQPLDQQLIEGCVAGKRSYQRILYERYSGKMFAICLRYAGDFHRAEDLLQEGFIKVFHHLHRFRADGSFEGWVKRIFINLAIETYRRQQRTIQTEPTENYHLASQQPTALDHLQAGDLLQLIRKLPLGYRTVFNLYEIEGYNHREIAEMLNIQPGTSKSQLARARYQLQKQLKEQHEHGK